VAVGLGGAFRAQHAGQQPGDRIHHHHRGQFAAGQHVIANGDFIGDQMRRTRSSTPS
jgi:hypothetical protein